MSIPDYQSFMLPVLVASSQGEVRIGQVVDELANQLELSQEDRSDLLPSGNRLSSATVFLGRSLI
jgi:restriction system protein